MHSSSSLGSSGSIEMIIGPMFAGKTTELFRRIRRYTFAQRRCLLIKFHLDRRYDDADASTHDKVKLRAIAAETLARVDKRVQSYDVIGIDEAQFFPDLVEFADKWANQGKNVVVCGIDGDFKRKPFGSILQLIPMAEHVLKLSSVCMICFQRGAFSKRIAGSETNQVEIGGQESYISACRSCFNDAKRRPPSATLSADFFSVEEEDEKPEDAGSSAPSEESPSAAGSDAPPSERAGEAEDDGGWETPRRRRRQRRRKAASRTPDPAQGVVA